MKQEAGFSLVEVLMATTITLVVLGLTASAFVNGLNANNAIELLTGTNQNLQTGSTFITNDLMKAGQDVPQGGITIPNGAGATAITWPRPPTNATDPTPTFPASAVMRAVTPGDALGPLVQDGTTATSSTRSDVITVLYSDRVLPELALDTVTLTSTDCTVVVHYSAGPPVSGTQLNVTQNTTVNVGDLFMFTNANGTTLQEVTTAPTAGNPQTIVFSQTGDILNLNQPALGVGLGGIKTLVPTPSGYPPVTMRRMIMATYYVDRTTPTQPLLMRRINGQPATPVAVGVENLQFAYDTFQSGLGYLANTASPADPNTIRKIDVYMAARSEDKSKLTKDYVRNSMQSQITVRSLGLFDVYR